MKTVSIDELRKLPRQNLRAGAKEKWAKPVEGLYKTLGALCAELRERRGMTQTALGRAPGLSCTRANIANLEASRSRIHVAQFVAIAEALGVSPEEMLRVALEEHRKA